MINSYMFFKFLITVLLSLLLLFACTHSVRNDDMVYVRSSADTYPLSVTDTNFEIVGEDITLQFWVISSNDNAINQHSMMYSGDAGIGGLIAQIAAHAAFTKGAQNKKLADEQNLANSILTNYQEFLNNFSKSDLDILKVKNSPKKEHQGRWKTESMPLIYFTPDLKTIRLRHLVVVRDSDSLLQDNIIYSNTIDVISSPAIDVKLMLESNDEQAFSDLLQRLYLRSIELAFKDISGHLIALEGPKTFVFNESSKKRVERGQIVMTNCHQKVIRNLRGWLVAYVASEEKIIDCVDQHG